MKARLALLALALSAAAAHGQSPQFWRLVWSDEFDGPALDPTKWHVINAPSNVNAELEYYAPDDVSVQNGMLRLTSERRNLGGRQYTSGKVHTQGLFFQAYGRFEARIRLPSGQGIWPAFWLLPESGGWPPEIDILELLGNDPTRIYTTHHWGVYPNVRSAGTSYVGPNFSQDFHVYAVEWFPDRLDWFIDGVRVFRDTTNIPQEPFFVILNTAVGGQWPGNPNQSTVFPQYHDIDYVRVYQWEPRNYLTNPAFEYPGAGTPGSRFAGWSDFGNAFSTTLEPHSGLYAAKAFGNFNGVPFNVSGFYQEVTVQPGQVVTASIYALHRAADALAPDNFAALNLEWYTAAGVVISFDSVHALDPTDPTDVYRFTTMTRTAPAGAAKVRFVPLHVQAASGAGAVEFDDASLVFPLAVCYANCDGSTAPPVLTVQDFSCFLNKFAAGDPYANCDGSTAPPTLNIADFACFLNAFAAGCS